MGQFNFNEGIQFGGPDYAPPPNARIYVYASGTERLVPIYEDSGLTILRTNPIITSLSGSIGDFYLMEGLYRFVVRDQRDVLLFEENDIEVLPTDENLASRRFEKVSDVLVDRTLSYIGGFGRQRVEAGDVVHVDQGTFSYEVLPASTSTATLITGGGVKLGQLGKWNPRALGDFADPARTHDTPEFQEAFTQALITGRKFEWDGGTIRVEDPITIDYADTMALSGGQSSHIDLSNCKIEHVGTDYIFRFTEVGNSATRPAINITGLRLLGNPDSLGGLYINSWSGLTIRDSVFQNFPAGSQCIWLHNDVVGDYTENFHIYNVKTVQNAGVFLKCSQGAGTASFSRLTVRDVFIAGTHEAVFDLSAGVYDSLFENMKGNAGGSTIFKLSGAMGGTLIRKVSIEQTGPAGICFDVSNGFNGAKPTIDFTAFSYEGSGARWEFGSTGLTGADFGKLHSGTIEAYGDVLAGRSINAKQACIDSGLAIPVYDMQFQVNLHATDSTNVVNVLDMNGNPITGFNTAVCGQLIWEIGNNQHFGIAPFAATFGGAGGLGLDTSKGTISGSAMPVLARDAFGNLGVKTTVGGYEGLSFKGHIRVKL